MSTRPLSHKRTTTFERFWFGVCYYPDQWDAATRERDAERMAAAGIRVVRMAEFAWDQLEPSEGRFDFSLFDGVIAKLGKAGIRTILGTPTAAPPRWLSLQHPEIRRVDAKGVVQDHGSRQHACHMSPVFRDYSKRITAAMTAHWRGNPDVIGWQTDNEIHCHFSECHCASCQVQFGRFLRARYHGDITALNTAWGTAFWAQSYRDFGDIRTPRDFTPTHTNPGQRLDYVRYLAEGAADFQADQVAIMRAADPAWTVLHNGVMANIDYHGRFSADLDVLGYDVYPFFSPVERRMGDQAWGLDRVRAFSGNFIVPEQQSGPGGQSGYFHDTPEPGELRRMTWSSIARGADALLYFRWRTARFGAEEYWYGIIDHDNVPRRRYTEVAQVSREIAAVEHDLLGSHVHVDCAVASAPLDVQAADGAYHLGLPGPDALAGGAHRALFEAGHAVGAVHPADDLSDVKLYLIPGWAPFDAAWVPGLTRWVEAGGTLVIGARTATRRLADNQVVAESAPGCLRALAGITVEEHGRQNQPERRPLAIDLAAPGAAPLRLATALWYEELKAEGAEVVGRWAGRHLDGVPAITVNRVGAGRVVWVGTLLSETVVRGLLPWLATLAEVAPQLPGLPPTVEVVQRRKDATTLWFLINHGDDPVTVAAPAGTDLLSGAATTSGVTLPRFGVAVVKAG